MKSKQTHVSEGKKQVVKEISELLKNKNTVLIASVKGLPASQFQEIKKKLRGKAIIKVPKKNLFFRAIDNAGKEGLLKIKEQYENSSSILFSDLDSYDLAEELIKRKSPSKAKAGQIAPKDIEVEAGPTDLPPGPAAVPLVGVPRPALPGRAGAPGRAARRRQAAPPGADQLRHATAGDHGAAGLAHRLQPGAILAG